MDVLTVHPIPYQGSKRRLAPIILDLFPKGVNTLYEPFAGSAAVTLAAGRYNKAVRFHINDSLKSLIGIWENIINSPESLSQTYEKLWHAQLTNPREYYDEVRNQFNSHPSSGALLFLLARCVKNAVRFNASGEFNQSPDKRRRGTKPERMRKHIFDAHNILNGKAISTSRDYADILNMAKPDDLVYMDPPYQGTSGNRDQRYHQQLDFDRFVSELEKLRNRSVPFIISFDGRCGNTTYGQPLPQKLKLTRIEVHAGRSSQATLNGKSHETYESLYVSPEIVEKQVDLSICRPHVCGDFKAYVIFNLEIPRTAFPRSYGT
jgi:DNA adenine methylase